MMSDSHLKCNDVPFESLAHRIGTATNFLYIKRVKGIQLK
jgi:hypothetical protein